MIKNNILLLFILSIASITANAQISCTNAAERTLTSYTTSSQNDSLFVICAGQTATLVATPPSGAAGWTFVWTKYNATSNNWQTIATNSNVPTSTQLNLQPGGYQVVITDGTNTEVGTFVVWVVRIDSAPNVSMNNIPASCGNVQLTGQVNNGSITPYYNPPASASDPSSMLYVDETTEIQVCYTGTHSWVSDLGFYLRGPAECGSPIVTVSPNPGANGQGSVCNADNNFTNLCFSTSSTNNFDPCNENDEYDMPWSTSNYTGTFGSYGPPSNPTPINWSPLYGCPASTAGWTVQVYDCIGMNTGALKGVTLNFSGTSAGGNQVSYTYQSPQGFSSPINDNSCTPETASIFEVPAPPPSPIYYSFGYEWTSEPPFNIPNNTSSLNITLSPGPSVDTEFTLSLTGNNIGAMCGGTTSATKFYDFLTADQAIINPVNTEFCVSSAAVQLSANIPGGTWSGQGITNASNGIFSPSAAGVGNHVITYTPANSCDVPATITMHVMANTPIVVIPVDAVCIDATPFQLQVLDAAGGTWSGDGIVDDTNGVFDPSVSGLGSHLVQYHVPGICEAVGMTTVTVYEPTITTSGPYIICAGESIQLQASGLSNYAWTNSGTLSANNIPNPVASPTVTTTYSVSGTDNKACYSSIEITVEVQQVHFTMNPSEGVSPLEVTFTPQTQGTSYHWDFGDGNQTTTSTSEPVTHIYYEQGIQTVTLTVEEGSSGCSSSQAVNVYPEASIEIIPNIITPDGSGKNDVFRIKQTNLKTLYVTIFNRFGNLVGTIDAPNGYWDPKDFPDGTYFYVVKAEGMDKTEYAYSGSFTVTMGK